MLLNLGSKTVEGIEGFRRFWSRSGGNIIVRSNRRSLTSPHFPELLHLPTGFFKFCLLPNLFTVPCTTVWVKNNSKRVERSLKKLIVVDLEFCLASYDTGSEILVSLSI